jgi:hypothetical protein
MSTWTAADIHRLGPPTIQLSVVSIWLPSLSETQGTSKKTSLSDDEVKTAAKMWYRQKDAPHLYRVGLVRLPEHWCGSVNKIHSSHGAPMRRPKHCVIPSTRRLCRGDSWYWALVWFREQDTPLSWRTRYWALVLFRQQDTPLSWQTHEITWTLVWFRQQDTPLSWRTHETIWTLVLFRQQDTPLSWRTHETTWTLVWFRQQDGSVVTYSWDDLNIVWFRQ